MLSNEEKIWYGQFRCRKCNHIENIPLHLTGPFWKAAPVIHRFKDENKMMICSNCGSYTVNELISSDTPTMDELQEAVNKSFQRICGP